MHVQLYSDEVVIKSTGVLGRFLQNPSYACLCFLYLCSKKTHHLTKINKCIKMLIVTTHNNPIASSDKLIVILIINSCRQ